MWLLFALTGPLSWAVSTHIDKYLVDRYFTDSDTAVLMVFTALTGLLFLPFIVFLAPAAFTLSLTALLVLAFTGASSIAAMIFYLRALQSEEASLVAPLFQLVTLFTFVLAWAFLGETLSPQTAAGAGLIVLGVLSLSIGPGLKWLAMKPRVVFPMVAATFILALGNVLFKRYAVETDFWTATFWTFLGQGVFGAAMLLRPRYRRQALTLLRRHPGALMGVNGANELINLGGGLAVRYAAMLAPVALVSAVASTTTLFVFLLGTALSLWSPRLSREDISAQGLSRKAVAAILVTAGVLLTQN